METKKLYRTKQREELLDFFRRIPGKHMTAGDVCSCLREEGSRISQATVYRQMEQLVDEGILGKFTVDPAVPSCFVYLNREDNCGEEACYHGICEKCGRVIHLHCTEIAGLSDHLAAHHGFRMNPVRTVFYGICSECEKGQGNETQESL